MWEGPLREPDPEIIELARQGDPGAFSTLVAYYQGDAWRLCFHLLRDEAAAEDATQEAFVRVFRFLPRYRGDAKFSTWLFSITRNCALDELRRGSRRARLEQKVGPEPDSSVDPGTAIEVREAILSLPGELRESVVLIDMFGLSYKDAAAIMSTPVGTVKSRVHRARDMLVARLGPLTEESADEA